MAKSDFESSSLGLDDGGLGEGSRSRQLLEYEAGSTMRGSKVRSGRPVRVLHLLSQQPGKTGSGVYLEALVRHGAEAGIEQRVVVGIPADAALPTISPLPEECVTAVRFGSPDLPFPVAGMSDVMPYESTRFSSFTPKMLESYLMAFEGALTRATESFEPDLIHSHHLWLATALARTMFPDLPLVTTCHGTELRQLELAPTLRPFVIPACSDVDRVFALHGEHSEKVARLYGIGPERIVVVGAGYRGDIFRPPEDDEERDRQDLTIVYAGKLSRAKGLPWLIEAFRRMKILGGQRSRLLIAGSAGTADADAAHEAASGDDRIVFLGALPQDELACAFREADVFVLPSFYEGLPLVLLEAVACGCRVVVTDLPGMDGWLPENLRTASVIERVPLPRLNGPDEPEPADLPGFTAALEEAISRQLERCVRSGRNQRPAALATCLASMTWEGVSCRVLAVYDEILNHK